MGDVHTRTHVEDGKFIIERVQDVAPFLEHNRRLRNMPQTSKEWRHLASIPNIVIEKWLNEERERGNLHMRIGDAEWKELVKRKLRDPDWAYLRTDK